MENKTEQQAQSRELVRVNGSLITAGDTSKWEGIVATFIVGLDVAESSRNLYRRTLSQFFLWLQETNRVLDSLTRVDILEYKDSLFSKGLSSLTISSYIVVLRKFYEWAEAEKLYPNIAKAVKTPRRVSDKETFIKENLSDKKGGELLQYFQEQSLRDYAIVNLILRTGLRTIEVVRADIEDITFKGERRILKVWGKGHDSKDDFVVLTDKAYIPIANYLATRKGAKGKEPLFISSSHRNNGERLTTRTISSLCKDGLKAIGLDSKQYTAHSLRHTAGCALIQKGAHIDDVMRTMRHSSPLTTMKYINKVQQEEHLKNPVETLLDEAF